MQCGSAGVRAGRHPHRYPLGARQHRARILRLLSFTSFVVAERYQAHVFLAEITHGVPTCPTTGEIAEVGWFDPAQLPQPVYSTVAYAITDAQHGDYGVLREIATAR